LLEAILTVQHCEHLPHVHRIVDADGGILSRRDYGIVDENDAIRKAEVYGVEEIVEEEGESAENKSEEETESEDTTDEDEEGGALPSEASSRKRIKVEHREEPTEIRKQELDETQKINVKIVQTTPPTCKLYEEELKEYDFWLLQNEQIY